MSVLRLPIIGQIEERVIGYSTSQATLTLFRDGRVRWRVPAFDVTVSPPYCIPGCLLNKSFSIGPLTEWVAAADLGFSPLAVPFELTVRRAEDILHRKLSTKPEILSWLRHLVWEDPGQTDLLVTSPSGQQSGMLADGTVVENIPGGVYFPSVPLVVIIAPDQGDFQVVVRAQTAGEYQLVSAFSEFAGILSKRSFAGTFTTVGQTATYSTVVPPSLNIIRGINNITISWSLPANGFLLESATALQSASWFPVQGVTNNVAVVPVMGTNSFFRLRRP